MEAKDLEKMRLNPVDGAEDEGPMDPDDASQALARVAQIFDAQEDRGEHPKDETADKIDATPLGEKAKEELREVLEDLHPADIAYVLEALPQDDRLAVWKLVDPEREGDILVEVNDGVRETLIDAMNRDELVDAVETLDTDEIADLVEDLPPDVVAEVQEGLSHEERAQLRAAMSYPEDSVGARMDFEMLSIREDVTLEIVLRFLRRFESLPDHTDQVFVVDRQGKLVGSLAVSQILVHDPEARVTDLIRSDVLTLNPLDDASDAAQLPWHFTVFPLIREPQQPIEGFLCVENARKHPADAALFGTLIPFMLRQRERFSDGEHPSHATERLMGLPEGWTKYGAEGEQILPAHRYKALGNAIALPCADYIMEGIKEVMEKED